MTSYPMPPAPTRSSYTTQTRRPRPARPAKRTTSYAPSQKAKRGATPRPSSPQTVRTHQTARTAKRIKAPLILPSPFRFIRCAFVNLLGPRRQGSAGYIADLHEYFPRERQRELVAEKGLTYQGLPLVIAMVAAPMAVNVLCYMIYPYLSVHFILANLLLLALLPLAATGRNGGYTRLFAPFFFEKPKERKRRLQAAGRVSGSR